MKNIVITGNARGFGYAMSELFYDKGCNIVLCDIDPNALEIAKNKLYNANKGKVLAYQCDVCNEDSVISLIDNVVRELGHIDIWINNAGVNQPNKAIWELETKDIDKLLDIDLKGTILCSKLIMNTMIKQGYGYIYNVEGYGSNDAMSLGLSIYGTSKRAVTYFTDALAKESRERNTQVCIGKITPGIMITDFITSSVNGKVELDEKTKKVYNILGDYPETIAEFMVDKILNNKENGAQFTWLTNRKATFRFITSSFKKRDFFNK